jgi:hypothetical protein
MAQRRWIFGALTVIAIFAAFLTGWVVGRTALGEAIDPATLPAAERAFVEQMQNAAMVGYFTVTGRENRQATPDRYDIYSVEKVGENQWRFNAKIGETGVTVPVVVPMYFIAGTPTIILDNLSIPGMGTFTARVVFDGDRYVGTWSHVGSAGGHMYGRIEHGAAQR